MASAARMAWRVSGAGPVSVRSFRWSDRSSAVFASVDCGEWEIDGVRNCSNVNQMIGCGWLRAVGAIVGRRLPSAATIH